MSRCVTVLPVLLSTIALARCAADPDDPAMPQMAVVEPPLIAHATAFGGRFSPERDGYGFARANDIRIAGGEVIVLENQNARLVVFDSLGQPLRTIGREGAGPGELRGVMALDAWGDEYAVGEVNNSRVSVFGRNGAFRRSFHVPTGIDEIAYGNGGTIYVNAHDERYYTYAVDREDVKVPFAERPPDLYRALGVDSARHPAHAVFLAFVGGNLHIYDRLLGALLRYAPDGSRDHTRRLPRHLLEGLEEAAGRIAADFGGPGRGWGASATDLTTTDDGRLLLLFPPVELTIGLLIDPHTYAAREIRWEPSVMVNLPGRGGGTGVVRGSRFWQILGGQLTVFDLAPP